MIHDNQTFAELRDYLCRRAMTKMRRPSPAVVDDLVHDTIERVLKSNTARNIEMTFDELRGFAWVTMVRLMVDNHRRAKCRRQFALGMTNARRGYTEDAAREVEIEHYLAQLGPRETRALFIIAEAGEGATEALKRTPGLSTRDSARLHKKLKRELA